MFERRVARIRSGVFLWFVGALLMFLAPVGSAAAQHTVTIVDTHAHPARYIRQATPDAFVNRALQAMRDYGVETTVMLPPPTPRKGAYTARLPEFIEAIKSHPSSFAFGAGPEHLNFLILTTPADAVDSGTRRRFETVAEKLLDSGVCVLGEFVAEHFSFGPHPYMSVAPDHPLLLLLADIAARRNVPIDLHMEAVPAEMPMPNLRAGRRRNAPQTNNPDRLKANLPAFERLLAHNTKAKIVWGHAGWDNTGERTTALMRRLLAKHSNLYMSIKLDQRNPGPTSTFGIFGSIRTEWRELLTEFSDRFVIGSDQFYDEDPGNRMKPMRDFINALPRELAKKVARENALELYRLNK